MQQKLFALSFGFAALLALSPAKAALVPCGFFLAEILPPEAPDTDVCAADRAEPPAGVF